MLMFYLPLGRWKLFNDQNDSCNIKTFWLASQIPIKSDEIKVSLKQEQRTTESLDSDDVFDVLKYNHKNIVHAVIFGIDFALTSMNNVTENSMLKS